MPRKTLLITGASAGIGAATAHMAAARGYDLALAYRSDSDGANAVAQACRARGAKVETLQADVADPAQIAQLFAQFDQRFDQLDGLVNNAGIVDQKARVTDLTPARLRRIFDVNVIGAILVAQATITRMQSKGSGAIVNVSSAAARLGSANQYVDYAATKAAIDIFTKGLADEVAAQGIRVNAVRPGLIETQIHAKGGQPDRAQTLAHTVPMQRTGTVDEVAETILFLLSDAASYVTGSLLDVTGGR